MIDEYYINNDTLILIPISNNQTRIFDINGCFEVEKNIFDIIDESCQYYGSSYQGRYVGAKKLLNMDYKLPIIMDEVKETIVFPTSSPKASKCCWVCLNNIDIFEKDNYSTVIKFINGLFYEINISYNSFENQIYRATLLLMKLKRRKDEKK